jgi:hypothetical protein
MIPDTSVIGPVQGSAGADLVPLPPLPSTVALPLPEQVREYIRASKAENTLRAITPIGAISAHGLKLTPYLRYRRLLRR